MKKGIDDVNKLICFVGEVGEECLGVLVGDVGVSLNGLNITENDG